MDQTMALLKIVLFLLVFSPTTWASLVVKIGIDIPIHRVHSRYLSVTLDTSDLGKTPKFGPFNFSSPQVLTLMRGLSPTYLRFGGTSADFTVFTDVDPKKVRETGAKPDMQTMSSHDWDTFINFTRSTGARFLYDFNLQLRYGEQWDPTNAIATLEYLVSKGYGENIDFELGNEPNDYAYHEGLAVLSGERIAQDFRLLQKVISMYPQFKDSLVVGPDNGDPSEIYKTFVNLTASSISAATWHHYYFAGQTATVQDYLNPVHFDSLRGDIADALAPVRASSNPGLPVWLGETSDAYNSGTANVSDRFVSGFLWLDKLGLSASMGIQAVFRQTFWGGNYALLDNDLNPNPDYWLSYVFKQLVGQEVLQTTLESSTLYFVRSEETSVPNYIRVYAHCTRPSDRYPRGAVTIFALNVNQTTEVQLTLTGSLSNLPVDQYLMLPEGPDGVLSKFTLLNGQRLALVDPHTLPVLKPTPLSPGSTLVLPPTSYAFFVVTKAQAAACMTS